jgi:hypothetical protein
MKRTDFCILSITFLIFTAKATAQQTTAAESSEIYQTISISQGQSQVVHDKAYYEQQVLDYNSLLKDIDQKVSDIKQNPEEHALALKNGWYEYMENNKKSIIRTRDEIIVKINSYK